MSIFFVRAHLAYKSMFRSLYTHTHVRARAVIVVVVVIIRCNKGFHV